MQKTQTTASCAHHQMDMQQGDEDFLSEVAPWKPKAPFSEQHEENKPRADNRLAPDQEGKAPAHAEQSPDQDPHLDEAAPKNHHPMPRQQGSNAEKPWLQKTAPATRLDQAMKCGGRY